MSGGGFLTQELVAVVHDASVRSYPEGAPFHPSQRYPEYPFSQIQAEPNPVYHMVRQALYALGLDRTAFGSPEWNPLGGFVRPGDSVVLKPNFVSHRNWGDTEGLTDTLSLVTHGSVVRAVADYVTIALKGNGQITVADAPVQATQWDQVCTLTKMDAIARFFSEQGVHFSVQDLRLVVADMDGPDLLRRKRTQSRPDAYVEVDLGNESLLQPITGESSKFAVSGYGSEHIRRAHMAGRHCYLFPRELLEASCVINLPKLKVHQKAGITCSLKNLVGINGHKDYLPHFRMREDEYPPHLGLFNHAYWMLHHAEWETRSFQKRRVLRFLAKLPKQFLERETILQGQGGWHGNDTLWRTVLDINRAFFYYHPGVGLSSLPVPRSYLILIDGIVGGECESPLAPSPIFASTILAGANPVAVDCVAAGLMGIEVARVPQLQRAFDPMSYPLVSFPIAEVSVMTGGSMATYEEFLAQGPVIPFHLPFGWRHHAERGSTSLDREVPSYPAKLLDASDEGVLE